VVGGYVLAVVAAAAAGWLYDWHVARLPEDTSGGMYAGGQLLTMLAVFCVVALAPTLLGLWFLRGHPRLWTTVGVLAVAFAGVGLVAVLLWRTAPAITGHPALALVSLLGLAQLLGVPLWTAGFGLFALLAPTRSSRRLMIAAVGLELIVGILAIVHWFSPGTGAF
jgi:hypothetical protein